MRFTGGAFDADDQHVFGEPAFLTRLVTGDAQCVALFAEQRVAAVAGADALDRQLLGEMHDEALVRVEIARRVQTLDEVAFALDAPECFVAHTRHQLHVHDDVGAVGDLDTAACER